MTDNTKLKLECYKDVTSLVNNMEYYNNQIETQLRKQVDIDLNKSTTDMTEDNDIDIDIRLACLTACVATNDWIKDCIKNYRVLLEKANLGIMPKSNKEKDNEAESTTTTIAETTEPQAQQSGF